MGVEDDDYHEEEYKLFGFLTFNMSVSIWLIFMSIIHWLNMIVTPFVMLWPDLFPPPDYFLWSLEVCFILDICRKSVIKKNEF